MSSLNQRSFRITNVAKLVVGGRATFREIAKSFEKVYGVKPKLKCLGSLEDLYNHMHELRAKEPQNFMAYIFM